MDNDETLAVAVALRLACTQLTRYAPLRTPDEIRDLLRSHVETLGDREPLTPERINLMAFRFACEELSECTPRLKGMNPLPANLIEDRLMRQTKEFLKGMNIHVYR